MMAELSKLTSLYLFGGWYGDLAQIIQAAYAKIALQITDPQVVGDLTDMIGRQLEEYGATRLPNVRTLQLFTM